MLRGNGPNAARGIVISVEHVDSVVERASRTIGVMIQLHPTVMLQMITDCDDEERTCDMGSIESALLITLAHGVAAEESVPQVDTGAVQLICSGGGGVPDLSLFELCDLTGLLSRMLQSHASGTDICL